MKLVMIAAVYVALAAAADAFTTTRCTSYGGIIRCTTIGDTFTTTRCTTIGGVLRCTRH